MADFLTRMTQRTLGLLPVVQPIIASKFGSESMGADMPGGLTPINPSPDQAEEESFEDGEEVAERVPPAPVPQSVVSRGVRIPAAPFTGLPQPVVPSQEQPSTPKVRQTKPAPIRPHEVQPLREETGGSLPSPLVPQPQNPSILVPGREIPQAAELPGREQTPPLSYTKHDTDPYRVGAGLAPALEIEASAAPTNKNLPSIASDSSGVVSAQPRISVSQENQPFSSAPTASNVLATKPRLGQGKPSSRSDVGTRFIASRTGETLVPAQSGEVPPIPQMPDASIQVVPHKSGGKKQRSSPSGEEISPLVPGQGQVPPQPYTKHDTNPYRVRAGLAPALEGMGSMGLSSVALPSALEGARSMALPPALVSPALVAESDIIEPGFPSIYPSVQSRRTETIAAGKQAVAQPSESHDAPIIKVTIGRIEVRAVTPTPPSPAPPVPVRAQRSQPTLSLEDYLKQRNGG